MSCRQAKQVRDNVRKLYSEGVVSVLDYLDAQQDYNQSSSNISIRRSATGAACSRSTRLWAGGSCPDRTVEAEESWSGQCP